MKFKGLIAALAATVMALSTVTASAETTNTNAGVYEANALEYVYPIYDINLLAADKITPYTQTTAKSCATTCAGMCVHKSNEELKAAGFDLDYADWYKIGSRYGYTVEWLGRSDINGTSDGLRKIFNYLNEGYPVCVWINSTTSGTHWVTVYGYSGDGVNLSASDFMCVDPARCWNSTSRERHLNEALNYSGVYNTVVFID